MLAGYSILVIGAAGLLGREVVLSLLEQGATVIAADINMEQLNCRFQEPLSRSDKLTLAPLDITDEESVKTFFGAISNLQGVVNCAYPRNSEYGKAFLDVSYASFNDNMSLHLGSAFLILQQSAQLFNRLKSPLSVVNMASIYGVIAPKFELYNETSMTMPVEYAAIKSAIVHLNKYVSAYIKDSRFRVNSVSPGGLMDAQDERFLTRYKQRTRGTGMLGAADMVGAVVFLLSKQSQFMTGQNLIIDDGFTL